MRTCVDTSPPLPFETLRFPSTNNSKYRVFLRMHADRGVRPTPPSRQNTPPAFKEKYDGFRLDLH